MIIADKTRAIANVGVIGPAAIRLTWSDSTIVDLDLSATLDRYDHADFAKVEIGDWGHSLTWPSGAELGADFLWLETLSATGHADVRAFIEWRLRHALSLAKAAEALGVSRRMVAYYSNGDKKVPKPILLACRGWEVSTGLNQAA